MPILGANWSATTKARYIAAGVSSSPYIQIYPWAYGTGFGTAYTSPTSALPSTTTKIKFSTSSNYILVGSNSSPAINVYGWSSSGFGSKYSNPAPIPSYATMADFNPTNNDVVVMQQYGTSYAYPWANGFGTRYSNNPALGMSPYSGRWSSSGKDLAVGGNASPIAIQSYPFTSGTSTGFGSKYTDPSVNTYNVYDCKFNPAGDVFFTAGVTPHGGAFSFTTGVGFGTTLATVDPGSESRSVAINPAGNFVTFGSNATNLGGSYYKVYPWSSSGFGTAISGTTGSSGLQISGASFSPTGNDVGYVGTFGTTIRVHPWSSSYGTLYSGGPTLVSNGTSVEFG